jgi:methyl-accepting chemotaxis protein
MLGRRGLTIRLFAAIASVALIAAAIAVAITSALSYRNSGALSQAWLEYNAGAAAKTVALSELRQAVGYGGMIHRFKNFIIRSDLQQLSGARTQIEVAASAIARYRALGTGSDEAKALEAFEKVMAAYANAFNVSEAMLKSGKSIVEIDKAVRVDDGPAINALTELDKIVAGLRERSGNAITAGAAAMQSALMWVGAVLGTMFLGLAILFTGFSYARILRPIESIIGVLKQLTQGDFNVVLPHLGRNDEIGEIAAAVQVFRDAGREKVRLETQAEEQRRAAEDERRATEEERRRNAEAQAKAAAEQAEAVKALADGLAKVSDGDLRVRVNEGFTESYKQIRDDFDCTIERLQETIASTVSSTREVAGTAAEISSSTTDLSRRTEEQAASLEQTSAALEEISATAKKNADSAQHANALAADTREVADRGGEVVAQTVSAMARIDESSRKISDIISVIDEIARQTNLLALNAAVEAARAGEAGRGFAVVASEVRSLAQRSSQAARDIKDLITNSSTQVQEGVELVNKAGTSLSEIVASIKKVAEIVAEIASASAEQSTGIDQVNIALTRMDEVTQQNSALVEENAAAAKALERQSKAMDDRVNVFRLGETQANRDAQPKAVARERSTAKTVRPSPPAQQPSATIASRRVPVGRGQAALSVAASAD